MTFLELLVQRRIPYRSSSKGGEIWICCPQPDCHDTRFRLGLNWQRNVGHCFNCGYKSRKIIQRVLWAWRIDAQIQVQGGEDLPEEKAAPIHLPDDFALIHSLDDEEPWIQPKTYLLQRGFTLDQLKQHRIGSSFVGRYAFRIVMPVYYRDHLLGIVARSWCGKEPKYLNSSGKRVIWNMEEREGRQCLILAEGIFKALALEAASDSSFRAAALLGHSITEAQIQQIEECRFQRILLWPDPDSQGIGGVMKIASQLQERGLEISVPWPLPTAQADDLKRRELRQSLRNPISFDARTRWQMTLEMKKR